MNRIFLITLFIISLLCVHSYGQKKGVTVHADPRLALLISKSRPTERPEDIKVTPPPAVKKEKRSDAKVPTSRMEEVKKEVNDFVAERNIPVKNSNKPARPTADELKAQRHAHVNGSTVGAGFKGSGYRVQIYNGTSREEAMKIKADFMRSYPGVASYLSYVAPNYRVKVGNFRRREDAMNLFQEANDSYKPCMIVPDAIGGH